MEMYSYFNLGMFLYCSTTPLCDLLVNFHHAYNFSIVNMVNLINCKWGN